jgi:hypothetical protein
MIPTSLMLGISIYMVGMIIQTEDWMFLYFGTISLATVQSLCLGLLVGLFI